METVRVRLRCSLVMVDHGAACLRSDRALRQTSGHRGGRMDRRGKRSIGVLAVGDRTAGNETGEGGPAGTALTRRVFSMSPVDPNCLWVSVRRHAVLSARQQSRGGNVVLVSCTDPVVVSGTPMR